MNIMVFDVPASTVGALSILNDFYNDLKIRQGNEHNWIFVLSKPNIEETESIKVRRFPWIKKSWLHRLYFDNIVAPYLVNKYKIDKVLSFQNVIIPRTKVEQVLYMHNALPFIDYKFAFKENKHLWIYQNIIGWNIVKSIKRANKVLVQSEWIKKACVEKAKVPSEKINVIQPRLNIANNKYFVPREEAYTTFFYPASEFEYKNHKVIIDACKRLKQEKIKNYKVIFTLKGDENNYVSKLFNEVKENHLPIDFVGNLSREQVFDLYTKSVLIFPSYIETFGLPLLEAKLHRGIIFASDCPFSHEILDGYENVHFFNPFDSNDLLKHIKNSINGDLIYMINEKTNVSLPSSNYDSFWKALNFKVL